MKKALALLAVLMLVGVPMVYAHTAVPDSGIDQGAINVAGGKLDMPKLIKFTDDVALGIESSKDFYQYINDEGWVPTDWNHATSTYVKLTLDWSILDFSK